MAAVLTTAAETTAAYGSSYFCSSAEAVTVAVLADQQTIAVALADVTVHGITDATVVTTAVAANFKTLRMEGIFGCPSSYEVSDPMIEALKLFLPYFPLHIQRFITMYLKLLDFMHNFEMLQNMINHMEEYQALFQMFENSTSESAASNNFGNLGSFFGSGMPDISSIKKMMEGGDLTDEFTYVEEPPCPGRNGS